MENYNDEVFEFGKNNEELENTDGFNYNSISGLGQSDYENEDLFGTDVDYNTALGNYSDNTQNSNQNSETSFEGWNVNQDLNPEALFGTTINNPSEPVENKTTGEPTQEFSFENIAPAPEESQLEVNNTVEANENQEQNPVEGFTVGENVETNEEPVLVEQPEEIEVPQEQTPELSFEEDTGTLNENVTPEEDLDLPIQDSDQIVDLDNTNNEESKMEVDFTSPDSADLENVVNYEEDDIETTDIGDLFDKVSVNVKDASDIFRKNTNLKKKIDERFDALKKLQSEIENSRKSQKEEIDKYKATVLQKLNEKKDEIEKRLNKLKENQTKLEKDRQEFEQYKKDEQEKIDQIQKEVQSAYDGRREELNHIEDVLRKQKDSLDEERNQLSLDKIQYEADKNELANNLLKFNELVSAFTSGVEETKE